MKNRVYHLPDESQEEENQLWSMFFFEFLDKK